MASVELREEWNARAKRPGLASVMSTRWSEVDSRRATEDLKTKVFDVLGDLRGQNLLEVGPGIGRFTGDFQNAGARVVAVDHSLGMINRARERIKKTPFLVANAAQLPLADGSFDTSVAITVLQHITDPMEFRKALDELKRVTKSRIVICDEMRQDIPEQVSPFTVLRTIDQFTEGMDGWNISSKDIVTCISDEYVLAVWERN